MIKQAFFALTLCMAPLSGLAAKGTLRLAVDSWAPFAGETLPRNGISIDVITTVLNRAGYQVESQILPWVRALEGTQHGQFDIIGNLFYSPGLDENLGFSAPYYQSDVHFLQHHSNNSTYSTLTDIAPYTIAVGAGYLYADDFDHATNLQKVEVKTTLEGIRMVASGRVEFTLDSIEVLQHILAHQTPELAHAVTVVPNPLASRFIHMAVRKTHPSYNEIIADFNRILAKMTADGSLDELLLKHQN